ncbi:proline-rich protein 27 [Anolis sagrei]|uniref:proline-rich protein 27 n=1 Tax=Anolis sagrei TaxID=38937 RepID=UPI00352116A9
MAPKAKAPAKPAAAKPAAAKPAAVTPAAATSAAVTPAAVTSAAVMPAEAKPSVVMPAAKEGAKDNGGKARAKETAQKLRQRSSAMFRNFPFNMASPKNLWIGLQVAAVFGVVVFIVSIFVYKSWTNANNLISTEKRLNDLRHTMSIGMRDRDMNYANLLVFTGIEFLPP